MHSTRLTPVCLAALIFATAEATGASSGAIAQAKRYDYAGYRLQKWHRNSEAIVYYTAAINANPSDFAAHFNRGGCYMRDRAYAKALDDFTLALKLDPKHASETYAVRASAFYRLGRDAECRADLEQARAITKEGQKLNDQLRVQLCQASSGASPAEVKRAVAILNQAATDARTKDDRSDALNNRAWFYTVRRASNDQDIAQAVVDATEACRLRNYRDYEVLDTLAAAYARHGDFERAIETEKKSIAKSWYDRTDGSHFKRRLAAYQHHQPYYPTAADRG
ncbi:MAG: tetratricopeptide repeat protein [Chthoniobacterales bacterium]